MLTEDNILNAWIVYWAGSALLVLVSWRITRSWVSWIRYPLLFILCALFFVPFNIQADAQAMAPAWLIMMFEGVFVPEVGFGRVGPTLGIAVGIALVLYLVITGLVMLVKKLLGSKQAEEEPTA